MKLMVLTFFLVGTLNAEDNRIEVPVAPKYGSFKIGNYRYALAPLVTNDGQTINYGFLFFNDLPIAGNDYYRLKLSIGSFIWYPPKKNTKWVGWRRINPKKKYSRWFRAIIEKNPSPDAKFIKTKKKNAP